MRRFVVFYTFVLLAVGSVHGQQKKLKVLISADMEGVGGVNSWDV